jgi:hypothetical protein
VLLYVHVLEPPRTGQCLSETIHTVVSHHDVSDDSDVKTDVVVAYIMGKTSLTTEKSSFIMKRLTLQIPFSTINNI